MRSVLLFTLLQTAQNLIKSTSPTKSWLNCPWKLRVCTRNLAEVDYRAGRKICELHAVHNFSHFPLRMFFGAPSFITCCTLEYPVSIMKKEVFEHPAHFHTQTHSRLNLHLSIPENITIIPGCLESSSNLTRLSQTFVVRIWFFSSWKMVLKLENLRSQVQSQSNSVQFKFKFGTTMII